VTRITLAALFVLWASVAGAHEIGTTRVSVLFTQDSSYQIEIVTDAAALLEKLEAVSGRTGAPLAAHDGVFRRRLRVVFDGTEVRPEIEYAVSRPADATSPAMATIHLSGTIPSRASDFSWSYSWTFATYALAINTGGFETPRTEWLEGGQSSTRFALASLPAPPGRLAVAWQYFTLGFTHIVPHGLDHVLFVLGIFLLTRRASSVLWQVSAFTLAHSITLSLSIYDVIAVPSSVVEPLIALSIAYVALENIFLSELRSWRVALVFAFGLLHGLGFAGVLKELGLIRTDFVTALVTFNLGVEAGQFTVIAAAFLLVGLWFGSRAWYRQRIVVPASAFIACVALVWTVQRLSL
jgi:hypothetical protein